MNARPETSNICRVRQGCAWQARGKLRELRAVLRSVAPTAKETLKWRSPAFEEGRILFA